MHIPSGLSTSFLASDTGRAWLEHLPAIVSRFRRMWSLDLEPPFEPGGYCSWTAPATRTTDASPVVLKVAFWHPEAAHEAEGLRAWAGSGAAHVYESWTDGLFSVLLLERCLPGRPLKQSLPEPEQDEIVASLLTRCWIQPAAPHPFRPLEDMCEMWGRECEQRLRRYPLPDPAMVHVGLAAWRELPKTAGESVLLATDLHGENILSAQREPWLLVDPKPYVGDPCYDPLQHMLNCEGRLHDDPVGLVRRMAGLVGVDADRLRLWLFARLCVDCDGPGDVGWSQEGLDLARRIAP